MDLSLRPSLRPFPPAAAAVLGFVVTSCKLPEEPPQPNFVEHVKPILEEQCLPCHNTGTLIGNLNLENREYVFSPVYGGPYVVPGDPQNSKLYHVVTLAPESSESMPPLKHQLDFREKAILRAWISNGAEWPDGPEGRLVPVGSTPYQTPDHR